MLLFNHSLVIPLNTELDFNTSNVTIQLKISHTGYFIIYISIHLMLLFNISYILSSVIGLYFNTSNVTIQPHVTEERAAVDIFQYI